MFSSDVTDSVVFGARNVPDAIEYVGLNAAVLTLPVLLLSDVGYKQSISVTSSFEFSFILEFLFYGPEQLPIRCEYFLHVSLSVINIVCTV